MRYGSAFALAVALTVAVAAQRNWQDGTWGDTDRIEQQLGSVTNGSVIGGSVTASTVPVRRVYQEYVIESAEYLYVAQQRLRWRWSKPVPMTVNAPVRFALEQNKLYVVGEDKKEYELTLVKKVLKTGR